MKIYHNFKFCEIANFKAAPQFCEFYFVILIRHWPESVARYLYAFDRTNS